MEVKIKATNLELTQELKDYIQKKMDMLEKYLGDVPVINCDVEVSVEPGPHQNRGKIYRTELNLAVPGDLLRVEKTERYLFKSIDKVKDHMARSIKKYRGKK